ncbi:hypothetical protein P280DRAFT_538204 [Massarina eburnea CBS 473.64]|uniref:Uncharacterized protein n=1 Tax=Massarina eburnea CBS 473.64 TaxID=1395130 RepID=A0A6A6S998_9PLEO|nr:hypothetical protein P280DRAFT_538204 [Massarina eburnea CBS 473.64]
MPSSEARRSQTVSSQSSWKENDDEYQDPASPSSPAGSDVGRPQRRRSQLHSALRSRVPSMRSQTSDTNGRTDSTDIDEGPCSNSNTSSVPDQEQFIDGQVRPTVNVQSPAYVRTFRRSKSTGNQYEAEMTPNMAYMDHQGEDLHLQGSSRGQATDSNKEEPNDPANDRDAINLEVLGKRRRMSQAYTSIQAGDRRRAEKQRRRVTDATIGQRIASYEAFRLPSAEPSGRNDNRGQSRPLLLQGPRSGTPDFVNDENVSKLSGTTPKDAAKALSMSSTDFAYLNQVKRHKSQKAEYEDLWGGTDTRQEGDDYFGDSVNQLDSMPPLVPPRSAQRPQSPAPPEKGNRQGLTPHAYRGLVEKRGPLRVLNASPIPSDQGGESAVVCEDRVEAGDVKGDKEGDYFGNTISEDEEGVGRGGPGNIFTNSTGEEEDEDLERTNQYHDHSTSHPTTTTSDLITTTSESRNDGHPAFRRQLIIPSTTTYPQPSHPTIPSEADVNINNTVSRFASFKTSSTPQNATTDLPQPTTHASRHPNRWYIALYHWITQQPSSSPAPESGSTFATNLRHDIAPAHWLLYFIQGLLWLGLALYFFVSLSTVSDKLAFECYELKTQLRVSHDYSSRSASSDWEPSKTDIPKEYRSKDDTCILTPLSRSAVISASFPTLFLTCLTCCGVAMLSQAVFYRACAGFMRRSGSYGTGTLVVRVGGQVGSSVLGVGIVVGIAWAVASRDR